MRANAKARARERERETAKKRENEREGERERNSEREEKKDRETRNRRGVDIINCHNVTAATVPKPGVTSARPAFEEKSGSGKEKER